MQQRLPVLTCLPFATSVRFFLPALVAASLIVGVTGDQALARPQTLGFAPAVPSQPMYIRLAARSTIGNTGIDERLRLLVDESGRPRLYSSDRELSAVVRAGLDSVLLTTGFVPGTFQDSSLSQLLPCKLQGFSGQRTIRLVFPVAADSSVPDPFLYNETLRLNHIKLPQIDYFPSYFFLPQPGDSLSVYPYLLVSLELDSTGRIEDIREVRSAAFSFTDQLLSVVNWATFKPAIVFGTPVPAKVYLMISLFSEVSYPTTIIQPRTLIDSTLMGRLRVRFIADTTGLLAPPIPRYHQHGVIRLAQAKGRFYGIVRLPLTIDSTGRAALGRLRGRSALLRRICRTLVSRERFYPALTGSGVPVLFRSIISFTFDGSENVRVSYGWLSTGSSVR